MGNEISPGFSPGIKGHPNCGFSPWDRLSPKLDTEPPIALFAIYREPTAAEAELNRRRDELAALRATLTARELAVGDLRRHLISFEGRYLRQVGLLFRQLDEWERRFTRLQISDATLEDLEAELEAEFQSIASPEPPTARGAGEALDLKGLFRELARRIHPDHAANALDEHHRTRLMAQANDAYRRRDAATLQRMIDGFHVPQGLLTAEAELALCALQIERIQQDILAVDATFHALLNSDHAQLETRCIEAALAGRDLLAEMAARIQGQIGLAMARYEREMHRRKYPARGLRTREVLTVELPNLRRN